MVVKESNYNELKTFEVFFNNGNHELYDIMSIKDFLIALASELSDEDLNNIYMIKERINQKESFSSSGATQSFNISNGSKRDSIDLFPIIKKRKHKDINNKEED